MNDIAKFLGLEVDEDLEQILLEGMSADQDQWDELDRLEQEFGVGSQECYELDEDEDA